MHEDKKEVLVEKEYMITQKHSDLNVENISRCHCGSSLVRIVNEPIIKEGKEVGREYYVICAECGDEVFGFTDIWECKHCSYQDNKVDIKPNTKSKLIRGNVEKMKEDFKNKEMNTEIEDMYREKHIIINTSDFSFVCDNCKKKAKGIPFIPMCGQYASLCKDCSAAWCEWYENYMKE